MVYFFIVLIIVVMILLGLFANSIADIQFKDDD